MAGSECSADGRGPGAGADTRDEPAATAGSPGEALTEANERLVTRADGWGVLLAGGLPGAGGDAAA